MARVGPVIRKLDRQFFDEDFKIQYFGDASGLREGKANAADMRGSIGLPD